jgi:hypothetical protein
MAGLSVLCHSCLHRTNTASGVMRQMFFAPEVSPRNKHRLGITFDKGFVSYFVWADLITLCCFRPFCSGRTFPIFAVRTISMHAINLLTTTLLRKVRAVDLHHADRLTASRTFRTVQTHQFPSGRSCPILASWRGSGRQKASQGRCRTMARSRGLQREALSASRCLICRGCLRVAAVPLMCGHSPGKAR